MTDKSAITPAAGPMSRLAIWRARLILVLLATVFSLALAEGVLRILAPGSPRSAGEERGYFCRFDPVLGWAPLPDITARHERDGFSVLVHQNGLGLRGPDDLGPARTPGRARERVLVLGDSYAWGYGADQDSIFTAAAVHGADLDALNSGVSGYGTDQAYLMYRRLRRTVDVDRVLLVFTPYNDIANNLASRQYDYDKPFFTWEGDSLRLHTAHLGAAADWSAGQALVKSVRVLNLGASLVRRVDNGLKNRRARRVDTEPGKRALAPAPLSDEARRGVDLTVEIIDRLRREVEADGASLEVAVVPYRPNVEAGLAGNHPFVRALADRLHARGIVYLEPYGEFVAAGRRGPLFNLVDNHFNARGHALFAERVLAGPGRKRSRDVYHAAAAVP